MRDTYAISRFMMWAVYVLSKDTGAQGWPKQSSYTKLVNIRGGHGFDPNFNEDAQIVDAFMTELKRKDITTFDIVSMLYNIRWVEEGKGIRRAKHTSISDQTTVAKMFGISQKTISFKLARVHIDLIDYFHEVTLKAGK